MSETTSYEQLGSITCPYCHSNKVVFDPLRGEYVCTNCGSVVQVVIDPGPEWRAFTPEQRLKRARTGIPLSPARVNTGLSTTIDWRNKDSEGHDLGLTKRVHVSRLRKTNLIFNINNPSEKNLKIAYGEIERLGLQLGLPQRVKDLAALLYKNAAKNRLIKGRSVESMVAACIYAACKINKVPRSLDEISRVSKAARKDISRSFRLLINHGLIKKIPPSKAIDFVPRLASELKLSTKVQQTALNILEMARHLGLASGRMPEGLAAAAVYLATILHCEKRTQREIASSASVTEVTIRNRFKELLETLDILIEV